MQNSLVVASYSKGIVRNLAKLTSVFQRGNTTISLVDLVITSCELQNQGELCCWVRKGSTKLAYWEDKIREESIVFS